MTTLQARIEGGGNKWGAGSLKSNKQGAVISGGFGNLHGECV